MQFRNLLASILAAVLALPTAAIAQQAAAKGGAVNDLRIIVLQGANATNSIKTRESVPPVVEVRDQNDRPLDGATVVFELPRTGAGGTFPGQQFAFSGRTNRQGQVGAPAFLPNQESGRFAIKVAATHGDSAGYASVRQTNVPGLATGDSNSTHHSHTLLWVAIAAAGAAVGAAVLATRGSSTPATPTITITPGPVTVGTPH